MCYILLSERGLGSTIARDQARASSRQVDNVMFARFDSGLIHQVSLPIVRDCATMLHSTLWAGSRRSRTGYSVNKLITDIT